MKSLITLSLLLLLIIPAFSQNLELKDGLYYKKDMLFTGSNVEYYDNGKILLEQSIKNGLVDGKMTLYYQNGNTQEIREYSEGKKNGTWMNWNEAGLKQLKPAIRTT